MFCGICVCVCVEIFMFIEIANFFKYCPKSMQLITIWKVLKVFNFHILNIAKIGYTYGWLPLNQHCKLEKKTLVRLVFFFILFVLQNSQLVFPKNPIKKKTLLNFFGGQHNNNSPCPKIFTWWPNVLFSIF